MPSDKLELWCRRNGFHSSHSIKYEYYVDRPEEWDDLREDDLIQVKKLRADKDETARRIKAFKGEKSLMIEKKLGKVGFPLEILYKIMEYVCDQIDGVKVLTMVLEDVHAIAISCPDFLATLPHCYKYLSAKVEPIEGDDKRDWDDLLVNIKKVECPELRKVLKSLHIPFTGKLKGTLSLPSPPLSDDLVDLQIRLLARFGLKEPQRIPAKLAYKVQAEIRHADHRSTQIRAYFDLQEAGVITGHWSDSIFSTFTTLSVCRCLFRLFKTEARLTEKIKSARQIVQIRRAQERQEWARRSEKEQREKEEKERRREQRSRDHFNNLCQAENCKVRGAKDCQFKMCSSCCPGCTRRGHDSKLQVAN